MKKVLRALLALSCLVPSLSHAAYTSRFDVHLFKPAVDGGNYFTVYDSQTLDQWQGNLGFYVDYANRPLQFKGTGVLAGRQSIIDHLTLVDFYGAIGFLDWFTAGINIPVEAYNWYFTDDATATPDRGMGMGDIQVVTKFRLLNIDDHKVGFAFIPFITLPTGDVARYMGNGNLTGGGTLAFDVKFHERFQMALNLGGVVRDDVLRNGVDMSHQFTFGVAANIKFSKNWEGIIESHGSTVMKDFFTQMNSTPLEAGGGVRYYFGDSGFSMSLGGAAGITEGVGSSRFRAHFGLNWTSSPKECPVCETPPDPRIVNNKIVLMGKIFYDTAKATIKPESYPVLDDVVDVLNKNPHVTLVEIQGHTDSRASDSYNMGLSQRRSQSALNYLVMKGISPSRLTAKGYGESMPIAPNTTAEGMSQNRRTEFVILQQVGVDSTSPTTIVNPGVVTTPVNTTVPVIDSSTPTTPVINQGTSVIPANPMDLSQDEFNELDSSKSSGKQGNKKAVKKDDPRLALKLPKNVGHLDSVEAVIFDQDIRDAEDAINMASSLGSDQPASVTR